MGKRITMLLGAAILLSASAMSSSPPAETVKQDQQLKINHDAYSCHAVFKIPIMKFYVCASIFRATLPVGMSSSFT